MDAAQALSQMMIPPGQDPVIQSLILGGGSGIGSMSGPWNPLIDMGYLMNRATSDNKINLDALKATLGSYVGSIEIAYAAAAGALLATLDQKPNNAATLSGNNAALGATYPGGVPVPLFLRTNGALAATPGLIYQPWMWIHRIVCNDTDANAGWKLAGGSVIVATDPVPSFSNDVDFNVLNTRLDRMDSPFVSLYNRPPYQQTTLIMSAIHYSATPLELVGGITIEWYDDKCPMDSYSPLRPSPHKFSPQQATQSLIQRVRQPQITTYGQAAPTSSLAALIKQQGLSGATFAR